MFVHQALTGYDLLSVGAGQEDRVADDEEDPIGCSPPQKPSTGRTVLLDFNHKVWHFEDRRFEAGAVSPSSAM